MHATPTKKSDEKGMTTGSMVGNDAANDPPTTRSARCTKGRVLVDSSDFFFNEKTPG